MRQGRTGWPDFVLSLKWPIMCWVRRYTILAYFFVLEFVNRLKAK